MIESAVYGRRCSRCSSSVLVVTSVRPQFFGQELAAPCPVCVCWPPQPGEPIPLLTLQEGDDGWQEVAGDLADAALALLAARDLTEALIDLRESHRHGE